MPLGDGRVKEGRQYRSLRTPMTRQLASVLCNSQVDVLENRQALVSALSAAAAAVGGALIQGGAF